MDKEFDDNVLKPVSYSSEILLSSFGIDISKGISKSSVDDDLVLQKEKEVSKTHESSFVDEYDDNVTNDDSYKGTLQSFQNNLSSEKKDFELEL